MESGNIAAIFLLLISSIYLCQSAKINTPRVLLPWFENLYVNFTFEIIDGGCYEWSLSRDDIIDLEPLYEDTWGHCSRSARVSVSKTCVSPGTVIILAQEVNSGEILRGDVDVDKVDSLKVLSTTWKLYLEEAPEAFEVIASDDQGNTFSTLEGVPFEWSVKNIGSSIGQENLVNFVQWSDTDYEAPRGVAELEAIGLRSYSVLLYGQAMGDCQVTVCLGDICTNVNLQVVPSVVLTPATAIIALGDTLRYKVVKVFAGRLTIQNIQDTVYYTKLPENNIADLEDSVSLVRGLQIGTTSIYLMSGATEVTSAVLTVANPYSIRVTLRPSGLIIRGEKFIIHSILLDAEGHAITAGDEVLIRLSVEGDANVDLLRSTENGTLTDAMAQNAGTFTVTARLHSIAGKVISQKVEGQVSAVVEDPLEVIPPELYVAWTETKQVWSSPMELLQVSSSGLARVGRPHQLHIALTAAHPSNGELYNYHVCDCASFAVSLLEGPEPQNFTSAPWIQPAEGACCVIEVVFVSSGVSTLRVSRARVADTARVAVSAAPALLWPHKAAALVGATLPVIAEGESLVPQASESRVAELTPRDGPPPYNHPDVHLFTLKCHKKGETSLELWSRGAWESESLRLEAACAPAVARLRLEPPDTPGNCSSPARIWLRPGHEVSVKVMLFDAIGRELLDERGPRVSWDIDPNHIGIEYRSTDRLFVQTHPDFEPVPVPQKFYQLVIANEKAIGWSGVLKASIDDVTASIQAKVVAPLKCEPLQVHMAWEGENSSSVGTVRGGSGKYLVEAGGGAAGAVRGGELLLQAPAPGLYHVRVADMCVHDEHTVEVHMEEIFSVEVSTSRAVSVGGCVPISALVKGISQRYLSISSSPEWRTHGHVIVRDGQLCGIKEGTGRVRAAVGGVWSSDVEIGVFGALRVEVSHARIAVGAKLQLRARGGPPAHLAAAHYRAVPPHPAIEVTSTGLVHGLAMGTARVKLVAVDGANVEIDSAEAEIEVVPVTGIQARAATRTLLVGAPAPLWLEAEGLSAASLAALHPPPRVTWSLRDPVSARLYTSYNDDLLERSIAEGLSVRVVPLKPGVITIDVRVRNMGQVAETRSWDSTIEIVAISDITTSVKGSSKDMTSGDRLALAVGAVVRLQSSPRSSWKAYREGVFNVTANGELRALAPGYGVVVAHHKDERINVYRETVIHVEVSVPQYCTAEAGAEEGAVRVRARSSVGRALLAPHADVSAHPAALAHAQYAHDSVLGTELLIAGVEPAGTFMTFSSTVAGVTVTDEVWVPGNDASTERIVATGGWLVCLRGEGWRSGAGVALAGARGVTLALLTAAAGAKHTLRRERPVALLTLHQLPVQQLEFLAGEWPAALVPLTTTAAGLTQGPIICTEEQKYALEGVQVNLPYTCRTETPHIAEPALDIINGQMGCKIIPGVPITEAMDVEVCAEWGVMRACRRTALVPAIRVSRERVSAAHAPATFSVLGHPRALRLVKITSSPGLKVDSVAKEDEIIVTVSNDVSSTCGLGGYGWVNVHSKLTAQELKVDVQRECDVAYGTVLGALFSLIRPYLSTLATIVAAIGAYIYIQSKLQQKIMVRMPTAPAQTAAMPLPVTPAPESPTPLSPRPRQWSRSPPAAMLPAAPAYGDASFSPNSQRRLMQ
ncbi:uncharacterized protein LOC115446691 isoform X2 [Manduca sexta]|uniref:uncharacterized protein LOC115446691 isoform X2 n=1 Tax=Manduca sexta TaxID=7130 RepID=UPI00188F3E81|nr:uncharacterized protein LOC115446691 isoform X2 [Manduca sexta]